MISAESHYCGLKVVGVDVPCHLVRFDRIRGVVVCPIPEVEVFDMNVKSSLPREDDSDVAVILTNFI